MDELKPLTTARLASGLTMAQLAAKSGVARPTLWRIETGRADPRLSTLRVLAQALQVPVGRLVE